MSSKLPKLPAKEGVIVDEKDIPREPSKIEFTLGLGSFLGRAKPQKPKAKALPKKPKALPAPKKRSKKG